MPKSGMLLSSHRRQSYIVESCMLFLFPTELDLLPQSSSPCICTLYLIHRSRSKHTSSNLPAKCDPFANPMTRMSCHSQNYHGSCRGVPRSFPNTSSALPISPAPLGAQYSPVCSIANVSMKLINDSAASSGVTATSPISPFIPRKHPYNKIK